MRYDFFKSSRLRVAAGPSAFLATMYVGSANWYLVSKSEPTADPASWESYKTCYSTVNVIVRRRGGWQSFLSNGPVPRKITSPDSSHFEESSDESFLVNVAEERLDMCCSNLVVFGPFCRPPRRSIIAEYSLGLNAVAEE